MTVQSQQISVSYTGDGVTTSFPVPFYFLLATDLVVTVSGVAVTLNTNYTVNGAHVPAGGAVEFLLAPASGAAVYIVRNPPLNQLLDTQNNETILAQVLNDALDKQVMLLQYLAALIGGAGLSDANFVTIRQAMSWLASQTTSGQTSLYVVDFAMSADIADAVTIQWRRGAFMRAGDALYSFIQTTLGITSVQMGAAFSAMKGLPA